MNIQDTIERDEVARLNRDAMSRVLAESGMTIHVSQISAWRPTKRTVGVVQALKRAEILATDGNLGLYKSEQEYWLGHIGWFSGEVKTLYSAQGQSDVIKPKGPKKAKIARKTAAQKVLEQMGIL